MNNANALPSATLSVRMPYLDAAHNHRVAQPPPGPEQQPGQQPHRPLLLQLLDIRCEQKPHTRITAAAAATSTRPLYDITYCCCCCSCDSCASSGNRM